MKPGVYHFTNEEYHLDPCPVPSLSRGTLHDLITKSPAHVYHHHPKLNPFFEPSEDEAKFDIGKMAHALLLEGLDHAHVIDAPDWRKKEAKEERDEARIAGKIPLLTHQYDSVVGMVQAAQRQIAACPELKISDLQAEGDSELTYIWKEGETYLRVRPDWISKDRKIILDYKTTGESADPAGFARKCVSLGYDIQDALYRRGVKEVEGKMPRFVFVVQETSAPYLCSFISLPPEFRAMAEQKVEYGKQLWEKCIATGEWPGYPNQVCYLDLPPWALAQWEMKSQMLGVYE